MSSYSVDEVSATAEVCVVASPQLAKSVKIDFITVKGSAGK